MPFKNGTIVPNAITWTEAMTEFLKENYKTMTNPALATALGLHLTVTRMKLYSMGLKRMELEYWTEEQIKYLKDNFSTIGDKELAILFNKKWKKEKGWTFKHIEKKRLYLNLVRTQDQIAEIKKRNVERGAFLNTTTWATRGVAPDGDIRIWENKGLLYQVIKVEGKFVHHAHWLYEKTYGKFKAGYVVGFKDRNNLNVVPENLESITRGEHAIRNRNSVPEEFKELKKAIELLNISIKKQQHEQEPK